jgi:hemoglobin
MNRSALVCVVVAACGGDPKKPAAPAAPPPSSPSETPATSAPATPAPTAPPAATAAKSLFDRLGGMPAITAVADEFVNRTTADPRIMQRFFNTDAANLKRLLAEFVCLATGGPCKYTGRDMTEAHAGMDLVDDEFNALVENLKGALDKFKVPAKEQGELLAAIGPLKPQIVVGPDKLHPIADAKLDKVTKLVPTIKDKAAAELLTAAVLAGKRGQRSYAEQLFSRAEMVVGAKALASVASTFREGAPPRVTTATKTLPKDSAPQPASIGSSEADEPDKKPQVGVLHGALKVEGKAPTGLGVVMMWPTKGTPQKRTPKVRVIEQRAKTFAPHVMAIPVGSKVLFPNYDAIYHNVFSISKVKQFDLGMYKTGEAREVQFDKPGIVRLGCNIHANMAAYLVVVDAPHYVVAGADGTFAFKSLAPGKYKVQAWGEQSANPATSEIEIKAGDNQTSIDLDGTAATGPSADKFGATRAAAPK